jgi:hypothetical protein
MKKKYKSEEEGHYGGVMPRMTVMQPEVINVSNEVAPQSVASIEIEATQKADGQKIQSMLGTEDNPFPETAVNSFDFDNREDGK